MLALVLIAKRAVVPTAVYSLAFRFSVLVKPSVPQPTDEAAPAAINDVTGFFCGLFLLHLLVVVVFKRGSARRRWRGWRG